MACEKFSNLSKVISLGDAEYLGQRLSYNQIQDHLDRN